MQISRGISDDGWRAGDDDIWYAVSMRAFPRARTELTRCHGAGGEKQRLAVSRLILKNPPLLFFDEAVSQAHSLMKHANLRGLQTSALDTHTEHSLLQNINSILREKRTG